MPWRDFHCKVCSAVRLPTSLFARIFIYQHLNLAQCKGMRESFASGMRILGFGIGNTAQGIQNPTNQFHRQRLEPLPGIRNCRAWNPESKNVLPPYKGR